MRDNLKLLVNAYLVGAIILPVLMLVASGCSSYGKYQINKISDNKPCKTYTLHHAETGIKNPEIFYDVLERGFKQLMNGNGFKESLDGELKIKYEVIGYEGGMWFLRNITIGFFYNTKIKIKAAFFINNVLQATVLMDITPFFVTWSWSEYDFHYNAGSVLANYVSENYWHE